MSKGALEGEKIFSMMLPEYTGTYSTEWSDHKVWQGPSTGQVVFAATYIDTSAYTLDDLTLFPMGAILQDPGIYSSSATTGVVQVLDLITQSELKISEVLTSMANNNVPGMLDSDDDFTQIIWGQYRTYLGQDTFAGPANLFLPANGATFGSGEPTTAGRLWCYRIIITTAAADGDTLLIPASRFVLNGVVAKEKEMAFIMRTKRSYELRG
jgi:hypothetical protein